MTWRAGRFGLDGTGRPASVWSQCGYLVVGVAQASGGIYRYLRSGWSVTSIIPPVAVGSGLVHCLHSLEGQGDSRRGHFATLSSYLPSQMSSVMQVNLPKRKSCGVQDPS